MVLQPGNRIIGIWSFCSRATSWQGIYLLFAADHPFFSLRIVNSMSTFSCKANMFALSPKRLLSDFYCGLQVSYQRSCCVYIGENRIGRALRFKQQIRFVCCVCREGRGGEMESSCVGLGPGKDL